MTRYNAYNVLIFFFLYKKWELTASYFHIKKKINEEILNIRSVGWKQHKMVIYKSAELMANAINKTG